MRILYVKKIKYEIILPKHKCNRNLSMGCMIGSLTQIRYLNSALCLF